MAPIECETLSASDYTGFGFVNRIVCEVRQKTLLRDSWDSALFYRKMAEAMWAMKSSWRLGHRTDYSTPISRLGYFYRQSTANAVLLEQGLCGLPSVADALQRAGGVIRLGVIGAGPATETIALARLACRGALTRGQCFEIRRLDAERGWLHACRRVMEGLRPCFDSAGVSIRDEFVHHDLRRVLPEEQEGRLATCDVLILSYALSEMNGRGERLAAMAMSNLRRLAAGMADHGRIMVTDRIEADVESWMEEAGFLRVEGGRPGSDRIPADDLDAIDAHRKALAATSSSEWGMPRLRFYPVGNHTWRGWSVWRLPGEGEARPYDPFGFL